ncbi:MAG: efflux RND transporter periplasmic adaptor subunit [Hyphomonadaceae bacterium]
MVLAKRNLIIGAVAVAVLAVGGIIFATMNSSGGEHAQSASAPGSPGGRPGGPGGGRSAPAVQVDAVEVAPKVFSSRIEALGTLEPRERVVLTANAADRVTGVYFEDGQRVAQGKVLMTLVNEEESALLESARATEANARLVYERNQRLASGEAIAQLELERSKSSYEAAVANVGAIQARLRDRVLVAPFSGVLGFRQISLGAYVSPGQAVATLIDDSQMRLEFGVPSIYLTSLRPGLEIKATTKDLPGRIFVGKLTSIDNAVDPITLAVKVRATLPNPDGALKAGTSMSVELTSQPRTSLSVSEISVIAEGAKNFVFVVDQSKEPFVAKKVEVTLGTRERGVVEVLAGLESGDLVVTDGVLKVRPNGPVRITRAGGGASPAAIASGQGTTDKSGLAQ